MSFAAQHRNLILIRDFVPIRSHHYAGVMVKVKYSSDPRTLQTKKPCNTSLAVAVIAGNGRSIKKTMNQHLALAQGGGQSRSLPPMRPFPTFPAG